MKKSVSLGKAIRLINAAGVILVTSSHKKKDNIITLAWSTPISLTPPLLGICVATRHCSAELIQKQREFIINVPDSSLLEQIIYCGSYSGHSVDKFKGSGLTKEQAEKLSNTPIIKECIGHVECRLVDTKEVGDHFVFIGEPVHVLAEEELFDGTWKVDKVKLVYHLGVNRFTTSSKEIRMGLKA